VSNETPARVSIFEFPELNQAKAVKSFFKANSASIHWSPIGMGVVINAKTDVDKTNESYYGESALHLLLSDGSFSCTVPFEGNKGPVHAVEWSPQGKDFMVLQGFQPAIATLFNAVNCTPIRSFGKQPRNTIIFSPHGRFVCLGGFGNLAGEMDFWDKNKLKLMGSCQDRNGAKSYEWTPDGRHFVTAVLWPKRRVDNGFKVFTYCGELVYHETVERLAQVEVRPAREGVFPNRPMSPRLSDKRLAAVRQEKIEAEKPKSYIPPHLRGRPDAAPSLIMRREADAGAQKLGGAVPGVKATVIARDPEEVKAEKNKQRRDRAKKKKEDENKVAKEEEDRRLKEEATREQQQQEQEKLQQEARADMSDPEARARKIKQLKKKLQQVQKLRDLEASGTELDKEQAKKMATGVGLEKELAALA
jgi:translation initiation factor 2A